MPVTGGIGHPKDSDAEYLARLGNPAYLRSILDRGENRAAPVCKFCRFQDTDECLLSTAAGQTEVSIQGYCNKKFSLVDGNAGEITGMIFDHLMQDENM